MNHGALILEDGSVWRGRGFGSSGRISGEVVFNTGMVGYVQSITDPSFFGQLVCQTYPLIGNYGVSSCEFESERPQIRGYIVSGQCAVPSHYSSSRNLDQWLKESGVPGIEGIDTRELTKVLRYKGAMMGILEVGDIPPDIDLLRRELSSTPDPNQSDLVEKVTTDVSILYNARSLRDSESGLTGVPEGERISGNIPSRKSRRSIRIVLIDCGVKAGIIRELLARGAEVLRVPAWTDYRAILAAEPDGILLSNGPGDPKKADYLIRTVRELSAGKIPLFGICLGTQILALAFDCDTFKMKFGHRGQNHPAVDLDSGRSYITSQNHGYAVVPESVKNSPFEIIFRNGNDDTVEGIRHKDKPIFGVQFHPEASPGPWDTCHLFDRFLEMIPRTQFHISPG